MPEMIRKYRNGGRGRGGNPERNARNGEIRKKGGDDWKGSDFISFFSFLSTWLLSSLFRALEGGEVTAVKNRDLTAKV